MVRKLATPASITAISVHPKGYYAAVGDIAGNVVIFSLDNAELITKFTLEYGTEITSICFDFEGKKFLIAADVLNVFDMATEFK